MAHDIAQAIVNHNIKIECKNIILYFEHNKFNTEFIVNVLVLFGRHTFDKNAK